MTRNQATEGAAGQFSAQLATRHHVIQAVSSALKEPPLLLRRYAGRLQETSKRLKATSNFLFRSSPDPASLTLSKRATCWNEQQTEASTPSPPSMVEHRIFTIPRSRMRRGSMDSRSADIFVKMLLETDEIRTRKVTFGISDQT